MEYPSINRFLIDWDNLVILSGKIKPKSRITGRINKELYELIERSLPIFIGETQYLLRVLYNKVDKRFYIDIRQIQVSPGGVTEFLDNGLMLSLDQWGGILLPTIKLLKKYEDGG